MEARTARQDKFSGATKTARLVVTLCPPNQTDFAEKVICLRRVHFDHGEEVRLGYYIIGKKPKMLGRWAWGQYATERFEVDHSASRGKTLVLKPTRHLRQ